jgi:nitroreductase
MLFRQAETRLTMPTADWAQAVDGCVASFFTRPGSPRFSQQGRGRALVRLSGSGRSWGMEFKQVVGTRRSIRYFKTWKPVEREKIQVMLEAANRASRAMNADFAKAIVVDRQNLSADVLNAARTPTTTPAYDQAPVHIYWYLDMTYMEGSQQRLKDLVDIGALTSAQGWSHAYVDEVVYPTVLEPIKENPMLLAGIGAVEAGLAICQAQLAAVDEGLGGCLHAFNADAVKDLLTPPDHWLPLWVLLVGYPAEDPEAGGQRPRRPLAESFYEGAFGSDSGWQEDPAVTARLTEAGMLQRPAPLPERPEELRALARMFGLPE